MKSRTRSAGPGPGKASAPETKVAVFPWDDVQYFLELVRKTTLLKAARRLGVSHTTVLRRIANLERRLDHKLFERTQKGFVLTEAGWRLLAHAEAMAQAADEISSVGHVGNDLSGPVRIAVVEGFAARILSPALPAFREQHPNIAVEVVTAMQIANLTRREADISIGLVRPTGPRLVARRLARCDVHLYASHTYVERHGEPARIEDIDEHVFVDYIEDLIEIPSLKWLRDTTGQRNVVFSSTSPLAQLNAVLAGVGIGMFPDYIVRGEPSVRMILPKQVKAEREFWLAIHEDLRNVPRMAAVFNFIKAMVQADSSFRR
ncbi:LysR family transcriptional regulator [Bradyrhizobium prioriisuperbiae]|uniref:LysR family transcriptional regulator n=1 Tax=Bradyrhizobium prioriisuperbiae TaxID=2854389 RepID=UPI0028F034AC|nr:LysR family transcriptional regulator [Bradyrhizobium prioritasuperba]